MSFSVEKFALSRVPYGSICLLSSVARKYMQIAHKM